MSRPVFHSLLCADEVCARDCPRARAEQLPRDPELREPVTGQLTITDALEEAAS